MFARQLHPHLVCYLRLLLSEQLPLRVDTVSRNSHSMSRLNQVRQLPRSRWNLFDHLNVSLACGNDVVRVRSQSVYSCDRALKQSVDLLQ